MSFYGKALIYLKYYKIKVFIKTPCIFKGLDLSDLMGIAIGAAFIAATLWDRFGSFNHQCTTNSIWGGSSFEGTCPARGSSGKVKSTSRLSIAIACPVEAISPNFRRHKSLFANGTMNVCHYGDMLFLNFRFWFLF